MIDTLAEAVAGAINHTGEALDGMKQRSDEAAERYGEENEELVKEAKALKEHNFRLTAQVKAYQSEVVTLKGRLVKIYENA